MKTLNAAILLVIGLLVFLAGLQLGGYFILVGLPGLYLVGAVVYDTLLKVMLQYKKKC